MTAHNKPSRAAGVLTGPLFAVSLIVLVAFGCVYLPVASAQMMTGGGFSGGDYSASGVGGLAGGGDPSAAIWAAEADISAACAVSISITTDNESFQGGLMPGNPGMVELLGTVPLTQALQRVCNQLSGRQAVGASLQRVEFIHSFVSGSPYLELAGGNLRYEMMFAQNAGQPSVDQVMADLNQLLGAGF